ncbi:M48 family metallopeptidase [Marinicella sp. W31]|uniref:M48 family metallopeptidase n=1 Tax=Marinicella sp. W31 TaxID=3023713 RepID=UPI003757CE78
MKFENPQIPENFNVSKRNHLLDFLVLCAGAAALITVVVLILGLMAGWLAHKIPFEHERLLSAPFENQFKKASDTETEAYLERVVRSIEVCSELPEGMSIHFHYLEDDVFNAFATLGGNIVIYKGLLERMENENELAMVIAHEIAHVKNRHPIQAMGRAVVVSVAISALFGGTNNPLEQSGLLTLLSFNRSMEIEADTAALKAMHKCYGHINGAESMFDELEKIQKEYGVNSKVSLFSTHPLNDNRVANIRKIGIEQGWPLQGEITEFPKHLD